MRLRITRVKTSKGEVKELREVNPPLGRYGVVKEGEVFLDSITTTITRITDEAELNKAFLELAEARDSSDKYVDISDKVR